MQFFDPPAINSSGTNVSQCDGQGYKVAIHIIQNCRVTKSKTNWRARAQTLSSSAEMIVFALERQTAAAS